MSSEPTPGREPLPKVATGIRGLEEVLCGGLPRGRMTLLGGGPGIGKTVLALEFLVHGALAGEPGVLLTFEERPEDLRRNALTFGWDLERLERERRLEILHFDPPLDLVRSGEFEIGGLLAILAGKLDELGAERVVVDAIDLLLRQFRDPHREEDQLIALNRWLQTLGRTGILSVKPGGEDSPTLARLEHMADCVLRLDHRVVGQVSTRRLRVLKFRGSSFLSNEHPYLITGDGVVLMPVSSASLASRTYGEKFATGVAGLDRLLDGGVPRGSSFLVGGPSGSGKTLLATTLATAAAERGERVLYVSFEESAESLISAVRSAGIELEEAAAGGRLEILSAMPEALGVEEHLWRIYRAIERLEPAHVIVDAISATSRMGSEEAAFDFLVRLLVHCRSRGTTLLYVNQVDSVADAQRLSGYGISSLIDGLLVLDQDWPEGAHRRRLLVVKVRGTRHAVGWRSFRITDAGLEVDAGR